MCTTGMQNSFRENTFLIYDLWKQVIQFWREKRNDKFLFCEINILRCSTCTRQSARTADCLPLLGGLESPQSRLQGEQWLVSSTVQFCAPKGIPVVL